MPPQVKFQIIYDATRVDNNLLSISTLCEIAQVSRSGYYNWLNTADKRQEREEQDQKDFELILAAYRKRGYAKGARSIYMQLLLTSLKLCFLCGYHISENTLKSIAELVAENGLMVVTTKRFLHEKLQHELNGRYCEIADGKGKWIVAKSFLSKKVKLTVQSFTGNKGEMRFTFGNQTVKMKISEDGESFEVL